MKTVKIKKPNKIVLKMLFIIIIKMMLKVKIKINKIKKKMHYMQYYIMLTNIKMKNYRKKMIITKMKIKIISLKNNNN